MPDYICSPLLDPALPLLTEDEEELLAEDGDTLMTEQEIYTCVEVE